MRKLLLIVALTFFPASAFAGTPTEAVAFFYAPVQYLPDIELRDRFTDPAKGVFFVWNDPFLLDDQLSEDERMIRDAARALRRTSSPRIENAYINEQTDRPSSARWASLACSA
jgi:hypothetical protein